MTFILFTRVRKYKSVKYKQAILFLAGACSQTIAWYTKLQKEKRLTEKAYFVETVLSVVRKKCIFCMSIDSNVFLCSHSQVAVFQLCEDINIWISLGWDLNEAMYSLPHF